MTSQDALDFGLGEKHPQDDDGQRQQRAANIGVVEGHDFLSSARWDGDSGETLDDEKNESEECDPEFAGLEKWFGIHDV